MSSLFRFPSSLSQQQQLLLLLLSVLGIFLLFAFLHRCNLLQSLFGIVVAFLGWGACTAAVVVAAVVGCRRLAGSGGSGRFGTRCAQR